MITQDRMEAAMQFLAESDGSFGQAKMDLENAAILQKRTRARAFLLGDGSVENKKAQAETHDDVIAADEIYCACVKEFETLRARRQRAELVVEVWRSLNASLRRA